MIWHPLPVAVLAAVLYWTGHNPLAIVQSPLPSAKVELAAFMLVGGFIAPVAEELCFRGILYTYFRRWGIIPALLGSTVLLLFLPKLLAIVDVILTHPRRDYGNAGRLAIGVILEILVSALLAPIRMLTHSRYVIGALFNVSLAWAGQNRTDETRWSEAIIHQAPGTLIGMKGHAVIRLEPTPNTARINPHRTQIAVFPAPRRILLDLIEKRPNPIRGCTAR